MNTRQNTDPIDIRHMPGFNPTVTNGIDSVSQGNVGIMTLPGRFGLKDFTTPKVGTITLHIWIPDRDYPTCHRHGAMLRVSKDGIYRCGELGCDTGCYWP